MNLHTSITRIVLSFLLLAPVWTFAQERIIPNDKIPSAIQQYVKTHFPSHTIVLAELEVEGVSKEYEVKLNDKTELKFDKKFEVFKIDGTVALPESVIPEAIRQYVKKHYPNNFITDWEKEWKHQEVKLDNGIEIEFTLKGNFIRIDY